MKNSFGVNDFVGNCYGKTGLERCDNEDNEYYWDDQLFMIVKKSDSRGIPPRETNFFTHFLNTAVEKIKNMITAPSELKTFGRELNLSYVNWTSDYVNIYSEKQGDKEIRAIREKIELDDSQFVASRPARYREDAPAGKIQRRRTTIHLCAIHQCKQLNMRFSRHIQRKGQ
jgi:hypothetical protein